MPKAFCLLIALFAFSLAPAHAKSAANQVNAEISNLYKAILFKRLDAKKNGLECMVGSQFSDVFEELLHVTSAVDKRIISKLLQSRPDLEKFYGTNLVFRMFKAGEINSIFFANERKKFLLGAEMFHHPFEGNGESQIKLAFLPNGELSVKTYTWNGKKNEFEWAESKGTYKFFENPKDVHEEKVSINLGNGKAAEEYSVAYKDGELQFDSSTAENTYSSNEYVCPEEK